MVSNKKLGTAFEREVCRRLAEYGYWVHFIMPDARGAQPFDIIAVRGGVPYAIDCKTCVAQSFSINRLEDNQVMAFDHWIKCGNSDPLIVALHNEKLYCISYSELKIKGKYKFKEGKNEKNNIGWSFDDYFSGVC